MDVYMTININGNVIIIIKCDESLCLANRSV